MTSKSEQKRQMILSKAEQVFIRTGFNNVTMKDIIEECGISRGGLYVYFSSVDEIFKEVVQEHNKSKSDCVTLNIGKGGNFEAFIDEYFERQKKRLLNMNNSLKTAMMEFCLAHKDDYSRNFISSQFSNSTDMMLKILSLGNIDGNLSDEEMRGIAENIMFFFEGITTLAVLSKITSEDIDRQFKYIKKCIYTHISKG